MLWSSSSPQHPQCVSLCVPKHAYLAACTTCKCLGVPTNITDDLEVAPHVDVVPSGLQCRITCSMVNSASHSDGDSMDVKTNVYVCCHTKLTFVVSGWRARVAGTQAGVQGTTSAVAANSRDIRHLKQSYSQLSEQVDENRAAQELLKGLSGCSLYVWC